MAQHPTPATTSDFVIFNISRVVWPSLLALTMVGGSSQLGESEQEAA